MLKMALGRQRGIQFESWKSTRIIFECLKLSQIALVLHSLALRFFCGKLAPPYHPVKCWTKTERDLIVGAFPRFSQLHVSIWSFITSDIPLFSDGPFMGLMGLLCCCDV